MNFIQKILKIFSFASDDKGLHVFFLKTLHDQRKIEKKGSYILLIEPNVL